MDERDLRLDGNAPAGMLSEIFGFEPTATPATCARCRTTGMIGATLVYRSAMGTVMRCPSCDHPMIRLTHVRGRYWLDMSGTSSMRLDTGEGPGQR